MTKELGVVLREGRKHLKLTQAQVAHRLGVSRAAVGQWESGDDPATDNLLAVCRELGIEVEAAISGVLKHIPNFSASTPKKRINLSVVDESKLAFDEKYPYNLPNYYIENNIIPFYPTFKYKDGMDIEITEAPMFFSPRQPEFPKNNDLYLMSVVDTNMEPLIRQMSMVLVDGAAIPSIGDLVLVRFDNPRHGTDHKKKSANMKLHKSQTAVIGFLADYNPAEIVVAQVRPEDRMAAPLDIVAAIHRILPPKG